SKSYAIIATAVNRWRWGEAQETTMSFGSPRDCRSTHREGFNRADRHREALQTGRAELWLARHVGDLGSRLRRRQNQRFAYREGMALPVQVRSDHASMWEQNRRTLETGR